MSGSLHFLNTDLGGAFGANVQSAEQLTQLNTTSAAFATFVGLTTPSIPAGTYRAGIAFQYAASNASTSGEYRLRLNGAVDLDLETLTISSAGERKTYANFGFAPLTAGVYTLNIEIRRAGGAGTFSIDDGHLEVWRVS